MTDPIGLVTPALPSLLSNTTITACTHIHTCRTLTQIIDAAAYALVAANYLSVHKNIPLPNLPWYWQAFEAGKIFLVALIFPDWIFVWALRSFIVARRTRDELEVARASAQRRWGHYPDNAPPAWQPTIRIRYPVPAACTISQAFNLIMGGIHVYEGDGTPVGPLDVPRAVQLIKHGELLLPPMDKIKAISKSSNFGKLFAIFGLVVFLAKCVLRLANQLPLAPFEVMAFANTLLGVCTFMPWWCKPKDVEETDRLSVRHLPQPVVGRRSGMLPRRPVWQVVYAYIFGNQDSLYQLTRLEAVPTFWSGDPASIFVKPRVNGPRPRGPSPAFFIATAAGLPFLAVFGLIHWQPWSSSTALVNESERVLWHWAAIIITMVPVFMLLAYFSTAIPLMFLNEDWPQRIMIGATVFSGTLYIIARLSLIVVACISLQHLPTDVYHTAPLPDFFH